MKKKLFIYLFAVAFSFMFSSCKFEDTVEIETYQFTVNHNEWQWNNIYGRYECSFAFSQLNNSIYENGLITAHVFVDEQDDRGRWYETQKPLPFSQTYMSHQMIPYTETISFDVSPANPYYITFYIQASDMGWVSLQTYSFKATLTYPL